MLEQNSNLKRTIKFGWNLLNTKLKNGIKNIKEK